MGAEHRVIIDKLLLDIYDIYIKYNAEIHLVSGADEDIGVLISSLARL
jgi:hypothetical protein